MAVEYELKYRASAETLDRIQADFPGNYTVTEMTTTYYDTPGGDLAKLFWTLRHRREGDKHICTLKTPAGIFTEVQLPIDSSMANEDSINTAKIIFQCYNDAADTDYPFGTPQTLLMVHKDEMHTFFEKNQLTDNISSFYTTYNSTNTM